MNGIVDLSSWDVTVEQSHFMNDQWVWSAVRKSTPSLNAESGTFCCFHSKEGAEADALRAVQDAESRESSKEVVAGDVLARRVHGREQT